MYTKVRLSPAGEPWGFDRSRLTAILRRLLVVVVGALLTVLVGCAATQPAPTSVVVTFKASAGLNQDPSGRALPLEVKLFELSSLGTLEGADFFSLYDDAQGVLGVDLQGSEAVRVPPGKTHTLKRELKPDSKYVALVAAYRDIENAQWRTSIEVAPNQETALVATLDDLAVSIEVAEE